VEAAAVMDYCSLIVTNDSGLMHLGAARKKKILAIFGPTVKEFGFFPYGTRSVVVENNVVSCRPCTHVGLPECPKKHFRCMKDIKTAQVIEAAQELLLN
jgi:heptosyltransferase-2